MLVEVNYFSSKDIYLLIEYHYFFKKDTKKLEKCDSQVYIYYYDLSETETSAS